MVKLRVYKWLLMGCVIAILIFIVLIVNQAQVENNSSSIFGRNVYNQSGSVGQIADPSYAVTFPIDHASHDLFDIEWWYLTSNLNDADGNQFGLQWTLFRFRNPNSSTGEVNNSDSTWHNNQLFMAHASVHSIENHWFSEKFARGGVGNAGVFQNPFSLSIDDWLWENATNSNNLLPASLNFSAKSKSGQYSVLTANLSMIQTGPFVLHGEQGYSIKSMSDHASHYYSAPFIDMKGQFIINDSTTQKRIVSVTGKAWFDHEWTSQLLDNNTLGWDWVSLHLANGSKLMAFRMRLKNQADFVTGSYISNNGLQTTLEPADINLTPLNTTKVRGKALPLNWQLSIPSQNINITISSIKDDQWNDASIPYYEGMVEVKGSHIGRGFIELTGY
ncbi:MAG: putative secreted hydrolase [Patiriisocius sp.]|jgi:predicted secreted hydrolase